MDATIKTVATDQPANPERVMVPNLQFPAADAAIRSRQGQRGPKAGEFEWTPASVETLTAMWADGATQPQIANALGTTRGGVAGKISRLGLSREPQTGASTRKVARHPRVDSVELPEGRLYFEDLTADVCHFP